MPLCDDLLSRKVGFFELFSYTTPMEKFLLFIAVISAMGNGAALPVFTLFFKDLVDGGFGGAGALNIQTVEETAFKFLYISLALLAVSASLCRISSTTASRPSRSMKRRALPR
jgi:ATP-binding cassette subfamily B (MDR/TAP) protein 1